MCSVDDTFVYVWIIKGCFWGFFRWKGRRFAFSSLPPLPLGGSFLGDLTSRFLFTWNNDVVWLIV